MKPVEFMEVKEEREESKEESKEFVKSK